eukprot:jgi/Chrzof1/11242/Cz05g29050.t1
MAAVTQTKALAGCRAFAFTKAKPGKKLGNVSNGAKWTMKRKDSYMVEVNVADDEPEDIAVRRFMKSVVQSGVINKLRARRHKESKIEEYARRLEERIQARKLRLVEPTWEEFYGKDDEPKPFDHYFNMKDEDDLEIFDNMDAGLLTDIPLFTEGAFGSSDMFGMGQYARNTNKFGNQQGGYIYQGGYINQNQGGNNNQQNNNQQGGYYNQQPPPQQGGYINQQPQQ